jgi:hypothetical protein
MEAVAAELSGKCRKILLLFGEKSFKDSLFRFIYFKTGS